MKREMTLRAVTGNIERATAFVQAALEEMDCPVKTQLRLSVVVDELFGNIAQYAYAPGVGEATLCVEGEEALRAAAITFIDRGAPFDPLARQDPDVTLPIEERDGGGLGVFMVKRMVDEIAYEYRDGQNILRVKKAW